MSYFKLFCLCCLAALTACSSTAPQPVKIVMPSNSVSHQVLNNAYSWLGTPYQYGGTSKRGTDCSGLVYNVYAQVHIDLPRTSYEQAQVGVQIDKSDAMPGDLIFFRTSGWQISHVGIINHVNGHELSFIHSSESQGVIISSLENVYWKPRFVQVVRVLDQ